MKYNELKKRKAELFTRIMTDKYAGVRTPKYLIKEYRFLQREQKRMIKRFKQFKVA